MGAGLGLGTELVAAVRAGDAEAVERLLDAGADPDTLAEDGLPVLCLAIDACAERVAGALTHAGADPDRALPDGTTPLLRAIERGSYGVYSEVLGKDPGLRLRGPAADRALALARNWYERRLVAPGERTRVQDGDWFGHLDELTLDGRSVRAGHGAILTDLEWTLRLLTPVEELADRGVAHPDPDHVDWGSPLRVLCKRRSVRTWSAVAALRHHPGPAHRRFAADVLRCLTLFEEEDTTPSFERETSELFAAWAAEESDPRVLADVLFAWGTEHEHPDMVATGLGHTGHPSPLVRAAVPDCLDASPLAPAARAALLTLARDEDDSVRRSACAVLGRRHDGSAAVRACLVGLARDPDDEVRWCAAERLSESDDHAPEIADALAGLLGEERQLVRVIAAYGLMRRDDPRTVDGYARIGPPGPALEHDHRWSRLWDWHWRREQEYGNTSAAAEQ
ncbi:HEAT repeat domain-containing protein [Streptomyces sp. NPDC048718]|uniref:HEAT repeat domain-containing protein n=1 Tax=Streptomyces sp. NPDC048718 TaxID=3365587 RepID=UPI00371CFD67